MIAIVFIAMAVLGALLEGWVLSVMWRWFIVPLGVPALTIPAAIGVALVVGMLTHQTRNSDEIEWETLLASAFINPLLALVVGWMLRPFI
jgi:uncharacterized SAM-binding protein YcdF (DUF218 family)